jgi:putative peptidoglycan lipid II flippase
MIKKLLNHKLLTNSSPSRSVASAAFLITFMSLASRIAGLLRDRLLASHFGAGDTLDVYYAAFRIPDLIYNLLILGALSAAFIPVFTSLISREEKEDAWRLARGVVNLAAIFIVIFSAIFCIFAPFIMKVITPGFPPDKLSTVVLFTRIMFLSPLFLGISGIFGGILTSFKRFFIYSLAPIFYNLGIIFGIVVLVRFMGPVGLAWGVVLGAFFHMLVQYPAARHLGYTHSWKSISYFKDRNIRKVLKLMVPRTLGIAVSQVNLLVITIFASLLASGSLAVFNFAQNLQGVPLGLFGSSFAIAVFPVLSAVYAQKNYDSFINNFSKTFRQILFFIIPISVAMILLRAQLVRVILGAGKFDWEDTVLTFQVLGIFSLSLCAQSLVPLLARTFYAMHDTRTPFYIALVSEAVNILTVILLIGRYKIMALALAFSLASIVQMILLLFVLRTKFENLDDKKILLSLVKISAASFLAGIGIQLMKYLVVSLIPIDTFIGVFTQLSVAGLTGAIIFFGVCYILKSPEFLEFQRSFTSRIFRSKSGIVEDTSEVSGIM